MSICIWYRRAIVGIISLAGVAGICTSRAEHPRLFAVRDDIELTQFGDVYSGVREALVTSPSGNKVVIHTTRGSLKDDRLHDELRIYSIRKMRMFVDAGDNLRTLRPLWTIDESTSSKDNNGPLISNIRWLADGSGIAFLLRTDRGNNSIYLALLGSRNVTRLTSYRDDVLSFDIRDAQHYVFTVASRDYIVDRKREENEPFIVGTDHFLDDLAFPGEMSGAVRRGELWAATGGSPFRAGEQFGKRAVILYEDGIDSISLSPDGKTVVTIRPLENVPKNWETLFPPPFPTASDRLRGGYQDLSARFGWYVGDYVRIDVKSGQITSLTNAPAAVRTGWWEDGTAKPSWSRDGSSVLLPGSFVSSRSSEDVKPCVLVVRINSGSAECVRMLHRNLIDSNEEGYDPLSEVRFAGGRNDRVLLKGASSLNRKAQVATYVRSANGSWEQISDAVVRRDVLDVKIKETFKDPPVLIATDPASGKTRIVFDPNPQLRNMSIGSPELYSWSDHSGRQWRAILYRPANFRPDIRYPLVIQNHGFSEDRFRPSGGFPSAFVAQELASVGIMVLQVRDCPGRGTQFEGPCNVLGYESAVEHLSHAGLIDSSRVGLIGFSRTVFYVLEALTAGKQHFAAASITDGITGGYMDYLCSVGPAGLYNSDTEALMGSSPFGSGLAQWEKKSPDFNMHSVTTPLRVVATRGAGVLEMWEPYALLERMHKPVDLIVLNTREHVVTDPAVRLAAQGGNVDWFRFWLQGYEDPDPSKLEQYARWRRIRGSGAS